MHAFRDCRRQETIHPDHQQRVTGARSKDRLASASAKGPKEPQRVAGAEWQAGITPGNAMLRILLNGNPVPLAFAASTRGGWVLAYAGLHEVEIGCYRVPTEVGIGGPESKHFAATSKSSPANKHANRPAPPRE